MENASEHLEAVKRAKDALEKLKTVGLARGGTGEDGSGSASGSLSVAEVEQLTAAARNAVAVVGRLERQSSGTTSTASDKNDTCKYASLRAELRRESVSAMNIAVDDERRQLFSVPSTSSSRVSSSASAPIDISNRARTKQAEDTAAKVTAGLRRAR